MPALVVTLYMLAILRDPVGLTVVAINAVGYGLGRP